MRFELDGNRYACNEPGDNTGEYVPALEALNASQEIRVHLCAMLGLDYCVDKDTDIYHAIAMQDAESAALRARVAELEAALAEMCAMVDEYEIGSIRDGEDVYISTPPRMTAILSGITKYLPPKKRSPTPELTPYQRDRIERGGLDGCKYERK